MGQQVEIKDGLCHCQALTLIAPVHFCPDVLSLRAELWPDRDGVFLKCPSAPSPLFNHPQRILEGMAEACDEHMPVCASTMKSCQTESARLFASNSDQHKIISIAFPKGVTCNNRAFNPTVEGDHALEVHHGSLTASHPHFKDAAGTPLEFPFAFGFWRLVVDGSIVQAKVKQTADLSADVQRLIGRVDHLQLAPPNAMETDEHATLRDELEEEQKARAVAQSRESEILRAAQKLEADAMAKVQSLEQLLKDQQNKPAQAPDLSKHDQLFSLKVKELEEKCNAAKDANDRERQQLMQEHAVAKDATDRERQQLMQEHAAAKEATDRQREELKWQCEELQKQKRNLDESLKQAAANQVPAEIRSEAMALVEEANRREQARTSARDAAAAMPPAARRTRSSANKQAAEVADANKTVCIHPIMKTPMTQGEFDSIIEDFAIHQNKSKEEVVGWMKAMGAVTHQDAIDLIINS